MRNYTLTLRTEAPVFVGSGETIGEKEYLFLPAQRLVCIPDMVKMFSDFERRHLTGAYEKYLLRDGRDFAAWLREKGVITPGRRLPPWIAYSVDSTDAVFENRGKKEILTFTKDAYGCPYVPGSSVKGMLRTVLLSALLLHNRDKLSAEAQAVRQADLRMSRPRLLARETGRLEQWFLHTLNRPDVPPANKVNDMMSGLRISDSQPLSAAELILCQKIDVTTEGQQKRLPILRECLRPGVEISFSLTMTENFPYPTERLLRAAERCRAVYEQCFRAAFPAGDIRGDGTVYLGGGCGYAAKTFAYPLLGRGGVETVGKIIDSTLPFRERDQHKHRLDRQKGVSPHMLKCTQYQKQLYEMGACSVAIAEVL